MGNHIISRVDEFPVGDRRIVEIDGTSIGVFNVNGRFYAIRNVCPHQAAPICLGSVQGMALPTQPGEYKWGREGEILRCPWHGWEFDLTNGRSVFNPHRTRVKAYDVTVEAGAPGSDDADEMVDTYNVTVEGDVVVLHT
jgi:3-phenylpropionate/trans-cinnamate dioxygenase ferredoxin subunit